MYVSRDQAYETLKSLQPAPIFLESYATKQLAEHLDIYFGPPEEFFIAPDTQIPYTNGRLVPILDDGNFGLILYYDTIGRSLIEKDIESLDEIRATYQNWQQYLASLMIRIAETFDDDDRVRRVATIVHFQHIDQLLACLDRVGSLPFGEYTAELQKFIAGLKP